MIRPLLTGADRLADHPEWLPPGNLGLLTNDAARSTRDPERLSRLDLLEAGVPIVRIFSPEHGIAAEGADGRAMDDQTDPVTELPVASLYGSSLRPAKESLTDLDGLLVDLPDAGARFYTYLWCMSHLLEAAREAGLPVTILDRPNPLGGRLDRVEGPLLDTQQCASYLGRAPMPIRHSLTLGEAARWLGARFSLPEENLRVISLDGWKRSMQWPDTGLAYVPPSPGLPAFDSLLCYPGTCFFEATNLSLGRGTDRPFRQVGAPWLDPEPLLDQLSGNGDRLPGVRFEPADFIPSLGPHRETGCRGVSLAVTDRQIFRPVRTGLFLLALIARNQPEEFRWERYPTAANPDGALHFELLIGREDLREEITRRPERWIQSLPQRLRVDGWTEQTAPFRLYE